MIDFRLIAITATLQQLTDVFPLADGDAILGYDCGTVADFLHGRLPAG